MIDGGQSEELVHKLLKELENYADMERPGDDFPQDTPLDEGQSVELVRQTYFENLMHNVYRVAQKGHPDAFIRSEQSDGGMVVGHGGPWGALTDAQGSVCANPPEGWTRIG